MSRAATACAVILVGALGLSACVKREVQVGGSSGGVGPALVVEQFLRAANVRSLDVMARLFGTDKGPIESLYPKSEVEQRMALFADELKHQDFEVTSEQAVPGRSDEARLLTVRIKKDDKNYSVPFTLVRYKENSWLIEQFRLDVLTGPR